MTGETHMPEFNYIVVSHDEREHWVMVVHDDSPEWYRRVATFPDLKRAECYAEMENDFARDFDDLLQGREGDDKKAPPSLPEEPRSALVPGELVRRSTVVEHTRMAQEEVRQPLPAPAKVLIPAKINTPPPTVSIVETVAPPVSHSPASNDAPKRDIPTQRADMDKLADAATLAPVVEPGNEPLTPNDLSLRQQFMLKMIVTRHAAGLEPFDDEALRKEGISETDEPKMILRLAALGCIVLSAKNGWDPTPLGKSIAAQIKAPAGSAPSGPKPAPKEVKITTPVVRHVDGNGVKPPMRSGAALAEQTKDAVSAFMQKNGARRFDSADSSAPFMVAEYLEKKGHEVSRAMNKWRIDGKVRDWGDVVILVNSYRAKADLPPISPPEPS